MVDLPWEYLYSAALNRFFSLSNTTPVIRYLDLPERIPPLAVQSPLRLLAMIAGSRDYPPLDVEQEWRKLRSALRELEEAACVILERLQPATLSVYSGACARELAISCTSWATAPLTRRRKTGCCCLKMSRDAAAVAAPRTWACSCTTIRACAWSC